MRAARRVSKSTSLNVLSLETYYRTPVFHPREVLNFLLLFFALVTKYYRDLVIYSFAFYLLSQLFIYFDDSEMEAALEAM